MNVIASGLDADTAAHWKDVLSDNGITAEVEPKDGTFAVLVAPGDEEAAKAMFADPFGDEGGSEETAAVPEHPLPPGDHTELLARTADVFAAQRLAGLLSAAGMYVHTDNSPASNAFGADGLPQVALWVAATQKDQAFKTLETFARENAPNMFDGAHNVSIDDIVEAITLTLKSQGR